MIEYAIASFITLLCVGLSLEIYTARTNKLAATRSNLNAGVQWILSYPSRIRRWFIERRERAYEVEAPTNRSAVAKWFYRTHIFVAIPLATYVGARAFESLAQDSRPIAGMYLSPEEAWYYGAFTGFAMAALAPLIAYIALFILVLLPVSVLGFVAKGIYRILPGSAMGGPNDDYAPFATLGAGVGGLVAAILLVMSY